MAKKKVEGECHICRAIGPLSFEHVPPHAAYNNGLAVSHEFTEWLNGGAWDPTGKKQEQRGVGAAWIDQILNRPLLPGGRRVSTY